MSAVTLFFHTNYLLPVCAGTIAAGGGGSVWVYRKIWRNVLSDCEREIERLTAAFRSDGVSEGDRKALVSGNFWMLDMLRDFRNALV